MPGGSPFAFQTCHTHTHAYTRTRAYTHTTAGDVVLGTEAVEEACREAALLQGLSSEHIAKMARMLEEYSHVPPRHDAPRRADRVVAVRKTQDRGGGGAGDAGYGGVAGGGYELDVVSVEGPKVVGINLKIERRVEQIVGDLVRKDASIRLPVAYGGGRGRGAGAGGTNVDGEWEIAARALVLERVCAELVSLLKVKATCIEASGLHTHADHILIDVNIHHQPDPLAANLKLVHLFYSQLAVHFTMCCILRHSATQCNTLQYCVMTCGLRGSLYHVS